MQQTDYQRLSKLSPVIPNGSQREKGVRVLLKKFGTPFKY
jgi:hypothetical protein